MNNISSIKSVKTESPKTPGGISKSLLTPCRRIGLSRNWKKVGPSPFISPLSGSSPGIAEVKAEKKESRKRKERVECDENEKEDVCTPETPAANESVPEEVGCIISERGVEDGGSSTPIRHCGVPRKKKSKTLLPALGKSSEAKGPLIEKNLTNEPQSIQALNETENTIIPLQKSKSKGKQPISIKVGSKLGKKNLEIAADINLTIANKTDVVGDEKEYVRPVKRSSSKGKNIILAETSKDHLNKEIELKENLETSDSKDKCLNGTQKDCKPKSPNELTKKCIVVIQKKIFKTDLKKKDKTETQALFDSDSDDVPLGQLNKEIPEKLTPNPKDKIEVLNVQSSMSQEIINLIDEEDDFIETNKTKCKKLEDKATSIGGLKKNTKNTKIKLQNQKSLQRNENIDFDEDDDDFDSKKTILVRKTYKKVVQPQRAKSTGSITQKDIDDLRARIETKKKMLLARAMTEDTAELRSLIKKWQKGCQDALMELMELMKTKLSDRPNMDYSEMLSMLKIPANLVGYDSENDCFTTPDDAEIILSKFNDI